jgi:hypothetical protein
MANLSHCFEWQADLVSLDRDLLSLDNAMAYLDYKVRPRRPRLARCGPYLTSAIPSPCLLPLPLALVVL